MRILPDPLDARFRRRFESWNAAAEFCSDDRSDIGATDHLSGGITNDDSLSRHLASRKRVDEVLRTSGVPVTSLKAGIIVGSGGSSFEIIRDLVEKLPVMVAPRWVDTRTQPIAIRNVLEFLTGVLLREGTYGGSTIARPDVMSYKERPAVCRVRGLPARYHCTRYEQTYRRLALFCHRTSTDCRESREQHECEVVARQTNGQKDLYNPILQRA